MKTQLAVLAAMVALAGCVGWEPAGRNAATSPAAPAAAPAVAPAATQPAESATPPAPVVAPEAGAPAAAAATTPATGGGDEIVVPGGPELQVPPPAGDPRSMAERMEDIRAWDQCVTAVQAAYESDPMRPQLDTPEDYCSRSLGMTGRTAVPESRRRR
jgi:hypothetical protein